MSMSGMMTIRERRFGMGDGILIGKISVSGGLARRLRLVQVNGVARFPAAADHHFDVWCCCFQIKLQLRHLCGEIVEGNQREDGDAQSAGGGNRLVQQHRLQRAPNCAWQLFSACPCHSKGCPPTGWSATWPVVFSFTL